MKFLCIIFEAFILAFAFGFDIKNQQIPIINFETPKANSIGNAFYSSALDNPNPSQITLNVFSSSGQLETVQTNVSLLNAPQDNPCLYRDTPIIKLCETLSCDFCMSSPKCGWCGQSNKCVPGNNLKVHCPNDCLSSWIFSDNSKCIFNVKSGSLNNIAPESSQMINPHLAEPKLALNIANPDVVDHSIKIKYGTQFTNEENIFTNKDGSIHTIKESSAKPLGGEIHEEVIIKNKLDTIYISLTNGTEIQKDHSLKAFGIDSLKNETKLDSKTTNNNSTTGVDFTRIKQENSFLNKK